MAGSNNRNLAYQSHITHSDVPHHQSVSQHVAKLSYHANFPSCSNICSRRRESQPYLSPPIHNAEHEFLPISGPESRAGTAGIMNLTNQTYVPKTPPKKVVDFWPPFAYFCGTVPQTNWISTVYEHFVLPNRTVLCHASARKFVIRLRERERSL